MPIQAIARQHRQQQQRNHLRTGMRFRTAHPLRLWQVMRMVLLPAQAMMRMAVLQQQRHQRQRPPHQHPPHQHRLTLILMR